ncbi:hypothetical protein O9992_05525 [Vibrio lentus]|nr:hypothetical protein [Vibrio lentus]
MIQQLGFFLDKRSSVCAIKFDKLLSSSKPISAFVKMTNLGSRGIPVVLALYESFSSSLEP